MLLNWCQKITFFPLHSKEMSWNCSFRSGTFTELNSSSSGTKVSACPRVPLDLPVRVLWWIGVVRVQERGRAEVQAPFPCGAGGGGWGAARGSGSAAPRGRWVTAARHRARSRPAVRRRQMVPEAVFERQLRAASVNVRGLILFLGVVVVECAYWTVCGFGGWFFFFFNVWDFRQRNENFWILIKLRLETGSELSWTAAVLDTPRRRTLKFSRHLK